MHAPFALAHWSTMKGRTRFGSSGWSRVILCLVTSFTAGPAHIFIWIAQMFLYPLHFTWIICSDDVYLRSVRHFCSAALCALLIMIPRTQLLPFKSWQCSNAIWRESFHGRCSASLMGDERKVCLCVKPWKQLPLNVSYWERFTPPCKLSLHQDVYLKGCQIKLQNCQCTCTVLFCEPKSSSEQRKGHRVLLKQRRVNDQASRNLVRNKDW